METNDVKVKAEPDGVNEADDVATEERLDDEVKKQYVCGVCIKQFSSACALNRHLKLHENKTFNCSSCTKTFQTKNNLTRHYRSVHTGSVKQHLCSYCGEWYRSRGSFIRHVQFIHKNRGKLCNICSKMCRDSSVLQRHLKSHFNDLEQCKGCQGHFKDLSAHKMSCPVTDRNPIFCEFCGKQFLAKRYLADHIKCQHIQSEKYLCHCGKIYPYRSSFKRHQLQCMKKEAEPDGVNETDDVATEKSLDDDVKKQYVCGICIKPYTSPRALNLHLKLHENKTFNCSSCTKTFQTKNNLTRHIKAVHTGSVKQHLCSYCGEWYRSRGSLIRHVQFIHKNRGKLCSICSKMCRDSSVLRRHLKSHFNDQEQCKGCQGHFKDLRAHIMNCPVKDRNPIFCEFCGKQFLAKRYLANHIKCKHTQPEKYLCHCGKIYPYRSSFKRHQLQCVKKEVK